MSKILPAGQLVTHSIEALNVGDMSINAKLQFIWETAVASSSAWTCRQRHGKVQITNSAGGSGVRMKRIAKRGLHVPRQRQDSPEIANHSGFSPILGCFTFAKRAPVSAIVTLLFMPCISPQILCQGLRPHPAA